MTRGAPFEPVTEAQANVFLAHHFAQSDATLSPVRPIGEGEWSKAYAYDREGAPYIIRFSNIAEDFTKDRIAMRFSTPDLPIPRIVEMGEAYGGFFAISERAPGGYIDALDGTQMRALLPSLLRMLDALRLADLSGTSGYGGWGEREVGSRATWRESLLSPPGQWMRGWHTQMVSSPVGSGPYDEALHALHRLVDACPEERHLIHADLLHFNVLVTGDRISAVIDWGCSVYGDFLYDVAWLLFWQPFFPAWNEIDLLAETKAHYASIGLHVPHMDERLRCYQVHIGMDGLVWNAYKENWADLEQTARRTLEVLHA
jgi:hygromycin-B 4-O-kinase